MPLIKVSHNFQVVIPKDIREPLGISKGDTLQVYKKVKLTVSNADMKELYMKSPEK